MTKVNRELRGGATQSPRSIESRPGAVRRKLIQYAATDVPVNGPSCILFGFLMEPLRDGWGRAGRSWGYAITCSLLRQKEWYRGGVTRRLFIETAGFCVVSEVNRVTWTPSGMTLESGGFPHIAEDELSTCCRQQWAGNQRDGKSTCGPATSVQDMRQIVSEHYSNFQEVL